jgi:hypothetical protein
MTKLELADMLDRFLSGDPGQEFSRFTEVRAEGELEAYRSRILEAWGDGWTDAAEIQNIITELRVTA